MSIESNKSPARFWTSLPVLGVILFVIAFMGIFYWSMKADPDYMPSKQKLNNHQMQHQMPMSPRTETTTSGSPQPMMHDH